MVWSASVDQPVRGSVLIANVRLPYEAVEQASMLWDVEVREGRVSTILPGEHIQRLEFMQHPQAEMPGHASQIVDANGSLLLPSLCHSHIHLDKCFILDQCGGLNRGDFDEALRLTGQAKGSFSSELDDLYKRGARVIEESIQNGVTSMRSHVEVDTIVGLACLDVGLKLQTDYRTKCDVQIAVFAQEPLFSTASDTMPGPNFQVLQEAVRRTGVSAVGSAPYVEPSLEHAKMNIRLLFDVALQGSVDLLDFHLDYNLDQNSEPLIHEVISLAKMLPASGSIDGNPSCPLQIAIGHATRLQLFSPSEWTKLAQELENVPVTIIGLPQSDMYMQGRQYESTPLGPPRSTLRVPYIAANYGIQIAMSVNNVDNAFTPQGSLDPLSLCAFGAAVFQTATPSDICTLAKSVTLTSKKAIGHKDIPSDLVPTVGDVADFVILHGRKNLRSAVLNPPYDRTVIKSGTVVVQRRGSISWFPV